MKDNSGLTAPKETAKIGVILLAFCAVLTDGFDTAILAMIVPHLAPEWGLKPSAFTYPLVLTNIGVVLGYLSCGALARWMGRKRTLVLGTAIFGAATILSAALLPLESMLALSVTRALTGIGLGVIMPIGVVVATSHAPERQRQPVAVLVTMGIISGATVAGFLGGAMIEAMGSQAVLYIAGIAPAVIALLIQVLVPATPNRPAARPTQQDSTSIAAIFSGQHRNATMLLWSATFLIFTVTYTLKSWLPTLFGEYGLSKADAGFGLAWYSLGGMVAGIALLPLCSKLGAARSLLMMSGLAAVATLALALLDLPTPLLMVVTLLAGAGITSGTIGQVAIAVSIYEDSVRATGVGWSSACGRVGSILGPSVGGILLALQWSAQDIVLLLAVPIVCTTVCWMILPRLTSSTRAGVEHRAGSDTEPAQV